MHKCNTYYPLFFHGEKKMPLFLAHSARGKKNLAPAGLVMLVGHIQAAKNAFRSSNVHAEPLQPEERDVRFMHNILVSSTEEGRAFNN